MGEAPEAWARRGQCTQNFPMVARYQVVYHGHVPAYLPTTIRVYCCTFLEGFNEPMQLRNVVRRVD